MILVVKEVKKIFDKRDIRWFLLIPIIFTIISLIMFISIKLFLNITPTLLDMGIIIVLSLLASAFISSFFYMDLKIAAYISIAGCISGIGYMLYIFIQPIDFNGIVGIISGVQLTFIFFLVGVNIELLRYLIKKVGLKN